ncbi:MAG: hypothetical protein Kow0069_38480 [Promethearchaeota archaeon]
MTLTFDACGRFDDELRLSSFVVAATGGFNKVDEQQKNMSISLKEVEYIASVAKCPKCGSRDVRFDVPQDSRIETSDGKLKRVVLDFSHPNYWLKTTVTHCLRCGIAFHIRDTMEKGEFYRGLLEVQQRRTEAPVAWAYDFYEFEQVKSSAETSNNDEAA